MVRVVHKSPHPSSLGMPQDSLKMILELALPPTAHWWSGALLALIFRPSLLKCSRDSRIVGGLYCIQTDWWVLCCWRSSSDGRVFIRSWCWDPDFCDRHLRKIWENFVSRQKRQSQLWIPGKPRKIGVCVSGAEIQASAVDARTAVWVSTAEKFSKVVLGETRKFSRKFMGVSAPALYKNPAVMFRQCQDRDYVISRSEVKCQSSRPSSGRSDRLPLPLHRDPSYLLPYMADLHAQVRTPAKFQGVDSWVIFWSKDSLLFQSLAGVVRPLETHGFNTFWELAVLSTT